MFEEALAELVKSEAVVRTGDRIRYVAPATNWVAILFATLIYS